MKNREKIIGSAIILLIFAVFLGVSFVKDKSHDSSNEDIFIEEKNEQKPVALDSRGSGKFIKVEIRGEVKEPGVYSLTEGSRVEDLISKAGGFTDKADRKRLISLAKKLRDEDSIVIYNVDEISDGSIPVINEGSGVLQDGRININTATKEELDTLPGIGPVTAQKIIDFRDKNGEFTSIEDLKKIDRIGDKTIENIKDKIVVQ